MGHGTLAAFRPVLETRHAMLRAVREFFGIRGFLEVETPVRIRRPALELHIDAEPSGDSYLRTSPEFHMKRLLADGYQRIFQVGACFRRGERGSLHHPEYTMLEWYRVGADATDILADTKALVVHVARKIRGHTDLVYQGRPLALWPVWERVAVRDAFLEFAGWDPVADFDADRFDMDLKEKVEPALPVSTPVILTDYPAEVAALARCKGGDGDIAERWELYLGGLEIANAYSELTDPAEHRRRFEDWSRQRRARGETVYPLDEDFLAAIDQGLPACGGIALGIDRLLMIFADAASLDDVLPFRE